MKLVKVVVVLLIVYAGLVATFESLLGYYQPAGPGTVVITTTERDGDTRGRVVSGIHHDGHLYVAANHWPRAWYREALAHPEVQVTANGETAAYRAVPLTGVERDRLAAEQPLGFVIRVLTGFPPRRFVRLDPL